MIKLYSFDIFDTIITRTTATPDGIFAIIQKELEITEPELAYKFPRGFYQTRVDSERYARLFYARDTVEEITFSQIYDVMQTMACITEKDRQLIMELELKIEARNSVPIEKNIKTIKRLINKGKRVVLISDMYLDSNQIRHILLEHCAFFNDIPIYVSSEYGVGKSSGKLFQIVRRKELVFSKEWIHIGDNAVADVSIPKAFGINAKRSTFSCLLKAEKDMINNYRGDVISQLFIGAARNNRNKGFGSIQQEFGSTYGAAILLQYVLWVLYQCKVCNIKNLYFVARDGFILKKILDTIKENKEIDISSKYIYGSRKAWKISEYITDDTDTEDYARSYDEIKLIKEYLQQEIDGSVKQIGFVEVRGVSGNSQESLSSVVASFTDAEIHSFYMILDRNINSRFHYHRMLPDFADKNGIVEVLTRALHGKTVGYYRKDDVIEPIFIEDESKALLDYGYEEYIQAVLTTISSFSCSIVCNSIEIETFLLGEKYLSYLMEKEHGKMFRFLCDIPVMTSINGHDELQTFAPKYSREEIDNVRKYGYMKERGWCPSFSLRRCSIEEREEIKKNKQSYLDEKRKSVRCGQYIINSEKLCTRVALYGIGKVGKSLYQYITTTGIAEVVVWTDIKIETKDGIYDTIASLNNYSFNQIIIAIKNQFTAFDVMTDLMIRGFNKEILFWDDYVYVSD